MQQSAPAVERESIEVLDDTQGHVRVPDAIVPDGARRHGVRSTADQDKPCIDDCGCVLRAAATAAAAACLACFTFWSIAILVDGNPEQW